jgi:transposase
MRRSSPPRERASAYICRGWTGWVPAEFPRRALRSLPLQPSARRRARWCPEPSLGRDRLPRERVDFLRLPAYSPELDPVERWFQEFRRELSNKAFETVELLQQALGQALLPYSGRTLLAYDSSLVSPGGWRPSMRCDINNPDRYKFPDLAPLQPVRACTRLPKPGPTEHLRREA